MLRISPTVKCSSPPELELESSVLPVRQGLGLAWAGKEIRRLISSFSFGDHSSQDCQECGIGTEIKLTQKEENLEMPLHQGWHAQTGNSSPLRLTCPNRKHPPRTLMCTQAQVMHMIYEGSTWGHRGRGAIRHLSFPPMFLQKFLFLDKWSRFLLLCMSLSGFLFHHTRTWKSWKLPPDSTICL